MIYIFGIHRNLNRDGGKELAYVYKRTDIYGYTKNYE